MTMRCVLLADCCRRFEVTTARPKQRREAMKSHLEVRAVTSVCPSAVQRSACSCLYTCPGPIIKDSRRTIKSVETEISWVVSFLCRQSSLRPVDKTSVDERLIITVGNNFIHYVHQYRILSDHYNRSVTSDKHCHSKSRITECPALSPYDRLWY